MKPEDRSIEQRQPLDERIAAARVLVFMRGRSLTQVDDSAY
jgi:hypothetical protein